MLTPVLVGLPGSGKSTLAAAVADCLGVGVFRSDSFFRECRALASDANDTRRVIAERFLERLRRERPDLADAAASDIGTKGTCPLEDGKRFRRIYGEDVFRTFEIEMLAWACETGFLGSDLPDLSASAPLYEENRQRFSREAGYIPVLIDVPHRIMVARVLADYQIYVAARDAGSPITIRGQYESALDRVAEGCVGTAERASQLVREAFRLTKVAAKERRAQYAAYTEITYRPRPGATVRESALALIGVIEAMTA